MAYCTVANVRARVPAFEASDISDEVIEDEAIAEADGDIDAALGSRYVVPLTTVPTVIKGISADLAAAWVLDQGFSGRGEEGEVRLADTLRTRANAKLEAIANGTWRGSNQLVGLAPLPGVAGSCPMRSSTYGSTPAVRDFDLYTEPASAGGLW